MARVADEVVKIPGHRVPPQDLDAERSVLGSMLLSTEAMADVVEILEADDFYRPAHGKIYQALRDALRPGRADRRHHRRRRPPADGHPRRGRRRPVPARPGRRGADARRRAPLRQDRLRRGAAPPVDRRGRRHHRHRLRRRQRRRRHRRRRRAAHLRRRPPRGQRGRRDHRRPDQPGDVRARVDPEPRVRLHGPPHRVPRPRRPHLGAATRQPRSSSRRAPASGSPRSR